MIVREILAKVNLRCNKSASNDYDNIWRYQVKEAYYKETLDLVRRIVKGKTNTLEGDEETSSTIDDLQILLDSKSLTSKDKGNFNESEKLPSNYLHYKRVTPIVSKGECSDVRLKSHLREEANVDDLRGYPSFDFEETFHTLKGNRVNVYHEKDFKIDSIDLVYYRLPKKVDFTKLDEVIEFNDSFCELIVDNVARLLNSDMENLNQKGLADERVEKII
jgi:hypothetical protein